MAKSTGLHSRGRNAAIGAAIGAAGGGVALAALAGSIGGSDTDVAFAVLLGGLVVGAPAGALVGVAMPPSERWQEVPLTRGNAVTSRATGLRVTPVAGHGIAASMTVGF